MTVQSDIWRKLDELFEEQQYGSAIKMINGFAFKPADFSNLARSCQTLADLNRYNKKDDSHKKAIGYGLLAGYSYVKMGRMAPAIALVDWLKEIKEAAEQAVQLETAISVIFSKIPSSQEE